MRKILLLLAFVGITALSSCEGPEGPQGPAGPEAQVIELNTVNFGFSNELGYNIFHNFSDFGLSPFDSDSVIMYRLSGIIDSQTPIWQQIPRTLFLPEGELDYDFDFSPVDFTIYADGTYNLATTPTYLNGQTFRIVIIPGVFENKGQAVDLSDYNAVVKAYHIDESKIVRLQ
jgi:hypothetical protein